MSETEIKLSLDSDNTQVVGLVAKTPNMTVEEFAVKVIINTSS